MVVAGKEDKDIDNEIDGMMSEVCFPFFDIILTRLVSYLVEHQIMNELL